MRLAIGLEMGPFGEHRSPAPSATSTRVCDRRKTSRAALACLIAIAGTASPALAAVQFDQVVSRADTTATMLLRPVVGGGADRLLVVAVAFPNNGSTVQSVVAGDRSFTHLVTGVDPMAAECRLEIWTLPAPDSGENLVSIAVSGSVSEIAGAAISYFGVDPAVPIARLATATGTSSSPSVGLQSSSDEVVLDALCSFASAAPPITPGPGQTLRWNRAARDIRMGGSDRVGAPDVSMAWSIGFGAGSWAAVALSLRASSSPPPPDASVPTPADASSEPDAGVSADAPAPPPDAGLPEGAPASNDARTGDAIQAGDASETPDAADLPEVAGFPADAGLPDAHPLPPSDAAGASSDSDGDRRPTEISLHVGCVCRAGGRETGSAGPWALLAALLVLRRQRQRKR